MLVPRISWSLRVLLTTLALATAAIAQNSVTVAWQNSSAAGSRLKDFGGGTDLSAGASAPGDGAVMQLGYFTSASGANPFAGTFIPLTGLGSANTAFSTTSVGDSPGSANGRFSIATTFVQGSSTSGQNLPAAGVPLVIRFYNRQTIAASTHYNDVSGSSATWQWKSPALAPGETILLSLSEAGLIWKGIPFQTSVSVNGSQPDFTLNAFTANLPAQGGTVNVSVTAASTAASWAASSSLPWVSILPPAGATGSGSVTLSVSANSAAARNGVVTIAGQSFTITQDGGTPTGGDCDFTLSRYAAGFRAAGGTGSFDLVASTSTCSWTAASNDSWISLTSPASGAGSATVSYSVASFSGSGQRTGTITVGDHIFKVVQAINDPTSELTVGVAGPGSVSGGSPTTRVIGNTYTVSAKPMRGAVFNGWTGANVHFNPGDQAKPALTFVMEEGTSLVANFALNPYLFSPALGTYVGYVEGSDPANTVTSGLLTVTLAKTGSFTGKLILGGASVSLKGVFTADGRATTIVKGSSGTLLTVVLTLDSAAPALHADVYPQGSSGAALASTDASPALATKTYPKAGMYTVILPVEPQGGFGSGFASMKVLPSGRATIIGKLPDGSGLSAAAQVDKLNGFSLYVPLYKNRGFVGGEVSLNSSSATHDAAGALNWVKLPVAASSKDKFYRAGFTEEIALSASVYTKPGKGVRVINLANQANNALFSAEGGNMMASSLEKVLTWDGANKLVPVAGTDRLKLKLNISTGVISGSFIHDATGKPASLGGVVLPHENRVEGLFLGNDETGFFSIGAP